MSKGSTRRPGVNYESNYERMFGSPRALLITEEAGEIVDLNPWRCTDCGSKAVAGGPDSSWKVCPNPACETSTPAGGVGVFTRPVPQADGCTPYPWCRLGTCRGSCPLDPNCGD